MKASKFSDAQKAFILKQGADGVPVADICRSAGISPATYFNWKKKYDGLLPTEMKRLKQLEDENGKLRKPLQAKAPRLGCRRLRCCVWISRRLVCAAGNAFALSSASSIASTGQRPPSTMRPKLRTAVADEGCVRSLKRRRYASRNYLSALSI